MSCNRNESNRIESLHKLLLKIWDIDVSRMWIYKVGRRRTFYTYYFWHVRLTHLRYISIRFCVLFSIFHASTQLDWIKLSCEFTYSDQSRTWTVSSFFWFTRFGLTVEVIQLDFYRNSHFNGIFNNIKDVHSNLQCIPLYWSLIWLTWKKYFEFSQKNVFYLQVALLFHKSICYNVYPTHVPLNIFIISKKIFH